ncbi:MAG TPA: hypothetical protein VK497_04555 [Candidatus Saccharimonadales bacterium]|nr:hypothetical protein [Candidatus Saccharimonadales bacterium]
MVKKTTPKVSKTAKKPVAKQVDIEPNKMSLAIASLAAVTLVLLAIIAMYI